jgi:hypothetical protein
MLECLRGEELDAYDGKIFNENNFPVGCLLMLYNFAGVSTA